nr:uncharacterized protein LOC106841473 isoform X2 [Equus asinus]
MLLKSIVISGCGQKLSSLRQIEFLTTLHSPVEMFLIFLLYTTDPTKEEALRKCDMNVSKMYHTNSCISIKKKIDHQHEPACFWKNRDDQEAGKRILQMGKRKPKELKEPAQDHTTLI